MNSLFLSFFFFLPAGIGNMMPVFAAKLPGLSKWNQPLDFGLTFQNKRILGDHKTVRGIITGILAGMLIAVILVHFFPNLYHGANPFLVGFLLSFGALAGDSIKSFFKRRVNIPSGKTWFPFDQIDYIVGGLVLSLFVVRLPLQQYLVIFLLYFCLHLLSTTIGYLLHLKKSPL